MDHDKLDYHLVQALNGRGCFGTFQLNYQHRNNAFALQSFIKCKSYFIKFLPIILDSNTNRRLSIAFIQENKIYHSLFTVMYISCNTIQYFIIFFLLILQFLYISLYFPLVIGARFDYPICIL